MDFMDNPNSGKAAKKSNFLKKLDFWVDPNRPIEIEPSLTEKRPTFGSAKGMIQIADDFDDPLPDFEEYRFFGNSGG